MQIVVSTLKAMISPEQNDIINKVEVEEYEQSSKSSKGTIEINDELNNNNFRLILDSTSNITSTNSQSSSSIAESDQLLMNISINETLFKLEEDGFITPDEKVKELTKKLTKPKF